MMITNDDLQKAISLIRQAAKDRLLEWDASSNGKSFHAYDGDPLGCNSIWRIKPQPREVMVRIFDDGTAGCGWTIGLEAPPDDYRKRDGVKFVKFREVLDD